MTESNQYAYIRVSTREQSVERQRVALAPFGLPESHIFCDHQSGKDFERPAYRRLLATLRAGDLLIIKSIDRLGRNYSEILTQWQHITKEIGADILVLDLDILDTRRSAGGLAGVLIADLVLQIFAYVAQQEREFIRQRQAEGITAARLRGQKLGRTRHPMPEEFERLCAQCRAGALTTRQAAARLGVSHSTFYRRYRERCDSVPEG